MYECVIVGVGKLSVVGVSIGVGGAGISIDCWRCWC